MRQPLAPARGSVRARTLAALRNVPAGYVTTPEIIAAHVQASAAEVVTLLARLNDDERETCPWHRIVAKGGAIGRGPWRDTQFARLVREGVVVSPAGIVQDMARLLVSDLTVPPKPRVAETASAHPTRPRSHGMKDRPGPDRSGT